MQTASIDDLVSPAAKARLSAFKADLVLALPGSVEQVILFGSQAQGQAHGDSDYDVAVILKGRLADDREVRRRVSDVAWDYLDGDVFIQAVPMNAEAFQPVQTELALRIVADGIQIP